MSNFLIIILVYFLVAFIFKLWRSRESQILKEWIPLYFCGDFKSPIPAEQSLIDKGEEIPSDTPTLFIIGKVRTQSKTVIYIDDFSNILTFGRLRFNEIIPEGKAVDLMLCFRNVSKNNLPIQGGPSKFLIKYPGQINPTRQWDITIPTLKIYGDDKIEYSTSFFTPEIGGPHELKILGLPGIRFAGPYGIGGRKYRIPDPGNPWDLMFHVSSSYEHKIFIVAHIALFIAILTFLITMLLNI